MQARVCDVCEQICKPTYKGKEYELSIIDWDDDSSDRCKLDLCESCKNKLKLWVQSNGSVKL